MLLLNVKLQQNRLQSLSVLKQSVNQRCCVHLSKISEWNETRPVHHLCKMLLSLLILYFTSHQNYSNNFWMSDSIKIKSLLILLNSCYNKTFLKLRPSCAQFYLSSKWKQQPNNLDTIILQTCCKFTFRNHTKHEIIINKHFIRFSKLNNLLYLCQNFLLHKTLQKPPKANIIPWPYQTKINIIYKDLVP